MIAPLASRRGDHKGRPYGVWGCGEVVRGHPLRTLLRWFASLSSVFLGFAKGRVRLAAGILCSHRCAGTPFNSPSERGKEKVGFAKGAILALCCLD